MVGRDYSAIILISNEGRREFEGIVGAVADPLQVLDAVESQLDGINVLRLELCLTVNLELATIIVLWVARSSMYLKSFLTVTCQLSN